MISRCTLDSIVFFKQKTAYGMRISDWSSDVCSSDLLHVGDIDVEAEPLDRRAPEARHGVEFGARRQIGQHADDTHADFVFDPEITARQGNQAQAPEIFDTASEEGLLAILIRHDEFDRREKLLLKEGGGRSEEHTSELQSLMRIS